MSLILDKDNLIQEGVSVNNIKPRETFIHNGQLFMKMDTDHECQCFNFETATRQLISRQYKVIPVDIHITNIERKNVNIDIIPQPPEEVDKQLKENRAKIAEIKEERNKAIEQLTARKNAKKQAAAIMEEAQVEENQTEVSQEGEKVKDDNKKEASKKTKSSSNTYRTYTEDELKLLYFKFSCELGHWAKTTEFDGLDRDKYPSWFTFHHNFGSKSNVVDAVCFQLRKEKMPAEYRDIAEKYFGKEPSGVYVIKKLNEGFKKK